MNTPAVNPETLAAGIISMSDEALVISVNRFTGEPRVAVHHKFKDRGGVLNGYLVTMLEELLGRSNAQAPNQVDPPTAGR